MHTDQWKLSENRTIRDWHMPPTLHNITPGVRQPRGLRREAYAILSTCLRHPVDLLDLDASRGALGDGGLLLPCRRAEDHADDDGADEQAADEGSDRNAGHSAVFDAIVLVLGRRERSIRGDDVSSIGGDGGILCGDVSSIGGDGGILCGDVSSIGGDGGIIGGDGGILCCDVSSIGGDGGVLGGDVSILGGDSSILGGDGGVLGRDGGTLNGDRVVVGHLHADVLYVRLGAVDGEDLVAHLPRARVPLESLVARVSHQGGAVVGEKQAVVVLRVGVRVAAPASSVASRDLRVRREVNVLTEDGAPRTWLGLGSGLGLGF
eukprot:scaffold4632_cov64-Phaeocystis_antarctica.AAC.2